MLEFFCVNKRCSNLDAIVSISLDILNSERTQKCITPKCTICNKQLKGTSKTKDIVVSSDYLVMSGFF